MESMLQTLLSWQFVVFGLCVAAVMFAIRKAVEYVLFTWKGKKNSKIWSDLLLPILPLFVGTLGAYAITSYPYPEELSTNGGRAAFGLVAGLMSGLFYRIVKALLLQKLPSVNASNIDDKQ